MEFKRKKGITELRGLAKALCLKVGNFENYNSSNIHELNLLIVKHLEQSTARIVLMRLPLRDLRSMLKENGIKFPADLIDIHRHKMVDDLLSVDFMKFAPDHVISKINKVDEIRADLLCDIR